VSDTPTPTGPALPPPTPPDVTRPWTVPAVPATASTPRPAPRRVRPGQLSPAWRAIVVTTWVGVFTAYMAVWKASEELGLATWWLGPRSDPQPIIVRLVPFAVTAVFGILASSNVPGLPAIGLLGSVVLAAIAVPDLSRSTGLVTVEFAIAGAVLLVSAASFTGTYRRPRPSDAG
jgi:hypothetical protein